MNIDVLSGTSSIPSNWSARLISLRDRVVAIGKTLEWDEDWMPHMLVEGTFPESTEEGEIMEGMWPIEGISGQPLTYKEVIGKPGIAVVLFPNMNDETKPSIILAIGLMAAKFKAAGMTFVFTGWKSAYKVKSDEITSEQVEERLKQEQIPRPSEDPNRAENLVMISVYHGGEDDGVKVAFADIAREEGKAPRLHNWTIAEEELGGRFVDAMKAGLRLAAEMRPK